MADGQRSLRPARFLLAGTISAKRYQFEAGAVMLQRTHPIIMVAAIAVTLLSVVGIGVLTGVIPLVGAMNSKPQPSGTGMPPAVTAAGAAHTMIGSDTNAVDRAGNLGKVGPLKRARALQC